METRASRIPEKLFFRIGEVCELIKVQPHVLRYWETEFPMLAPQKNRAGQRVYRRKDVEMVMRIRDLLYEEKFTIAGAKKKLIDEMRGSGARTKAHVREPLPANDPIIEESVEPREADSPPAEAPPADADQGMSPRARRAIRVIKHDLEELLTILNTGGSITS